MSDRAYAVTSLGLVMLACVLCVVLPPRAGAAELTPCPTAEPAPTVTPAATVSDDAAAVVDALQLNRREAREACEAVAGRLDLVRESAADSATALGGTIDVDIGRGTVGEPLHVVTPEPSSTAVPAELPAGTDSDPMTVALAGDDARQLFSLRYLVAFLAGVALFGAVFSTIRRAWGF